jgi:lysophospholipase L1-like esterase
MDNDIVLFLGSSSIRKWKTPNMSMNADVINFGMSRLTTNELGKYFDHLPNISPKYILVWIGMNDVLYSRNQPNQIIENITQFTEILLIKFPKSHIVVLSILKSPKLYDLRKDKTVDYINRKLKDYYMATKNKSVYRNINRYLHDDKYYGVDRFHLNSLGYAKLNEHFVIG